MSFTILFYRYHLNQHLLNLSIEERFVLRSSWNSLPISAELSYQLRQIQTSDIECHVRSPAFIALSTFRFYSMLSTETMFRPPVNRSMRILDRSFFKKEIPLSAARISNNEHISSVRKDLERSKDLLVAERIGQVQPDPDPGLAAKRKKCLLLKPEIKLDGMPHRVSGYMITYMHPSSWVSWTGTWADGMIKILQPGARYCEDV